MLYRESRCKYWYNETYSFIHYEIINNVKEEYVTYFEIAKWSGKKIFSIIRYFSPFNFVQCYRGITFSFSLIYALYISSRRSLSLSLSRSLSFLLLSFAKYIDRNIVSLNVIYTPVIFESNLPVQQFPTSIQTHKKFLENYTLFTCRTSQFSRHVGFMMLPGCLCSSC